MYLQPKLKTSIDAVLMLKSHLSAKQPRRQLEEYITYIKDLGRRIPHGPLDFVIPNVVRRLAQVIRQHSLEDGFHEKQEKGFKELNTAIKQGPPLIRQNTKSLTEGPVQDGILKNFVLPAIDDVIEELESHSEDINSYASLHFFTNEVIMVYEYSTTVLKFLMSANKTIEIIVVESETECLGKVLAEELSNKGMNVTLIPFTNAFALMQRVNKILLGVDAILKDGGLLMHPGTYALSVSAKQFSVPVIALSGAHKLTPKYAFDQNTFNELISPLKITDTLSMSNNNTYIGITYDYVPPEYITLYITNQGQYTPQSIYQLFNDFYNSKDEDI